MSALFIRTPTRVNGQIYPTNTVPLVDLDSPEPSIFDRLTKAHRLVELAREKSRDQDQDQRGRLTHIATLIAVEMEELRP